MPAQLTQPNALPDRSHRQQQDSWWRRVYYRIRLKPGEFHTELLRVIE
ncbi:hypothetical protein [Aestuariirhabdus sp. LZHN29]